MKKILIALALLQTLALSIIPQFALADSARNPCAYIVNSNQYGACQDVSNANPLPTYQGGATYTDISTSTNTVIKTSAGTLQGFTVNTAGTSLVLFDNTTCTGTKIGTFTTSAQTSIKIDAAFTVGLCATTVGGDITVLWR